MEALVVVVVVVVVVLGGGAILKSLVKTGSQDPLEV
jgi:hypothetical protein